MNGIDAAALDRAVRSFPTLLRIARSIGPELSTSHLTGYAWDLLIAEYHRQRATPQGEKE